MKRCEEVLLNAGYIFARPDEGFYVVELFGKVWIIISNETPESLQEKLRSIASPKELRREFYCVEAVKLQL